MTRLISPYLLLAAAPCLVASAKDEDARIEAAARKSYTFKVDLRDDAVHVACRDGKVTLTGTVGDARRRTLAEETVAELPGVVSVDNRILVPGQPTEGSDLWLAAKVKAALLYHRNVDGAATKVDAKDGVVTLSGPASSAAQKALAGDVAANVEGVRSVTNSMKVDPATKAAPLAEKIDDASTTAHVKAALLLHKGTHALTTKVRTRRGVVTVEGAAASGAERELVTRVVSRIQGVRRVDNRMTVEG